MSAQDYLPPLNSAVSPAALSPFRLSGFSGDWASQDRGFVGQVRKMGDDRIPKV